MNVKYIVKLEWNEVPMILVKDIKGYNNKTIPYAFKRYDFGYSVAYFTSKESAIEATKEARKYYSYSGIPVILEAIEIDA